VNEEEIPLNFGDQMFAVNSFIKTKRPVKWAWCFAVASCVLPFLWPFSFCLVKCHSYSIPSWSCTDHIVRSTVYLVPTLGFAFGLYAVSLRVWNPELAKMQAELRLPIILGFVINILLYIGTYSLFGW
jgi:hypothetical protein